MSRKLRSAKRDYTAMRHRIYFLAVEKKKIFNNFYSISEVKMTEIVSVIKLNWDFILKDWTGMISPIEPTNQLCGMCFINNVLMSF